MPSWLLRPRTIAIAAFGLLALLGACVVASSLAQAPFANAQSGRATWRAALPNYAATPWAITYFREQQQQVRVYQTYVGWRLAPFTGATINVVGDYGERRTAAPAQAGGSTMYFFGGTAMWGGGADDDSTIPSRLAMGLGVTARNFAAPGYTAHQSLQMLIRLVQDGQRPDMVVFFDGVDDIAAKCRADNGVFSTADESQWRKLLSPTVGSPGYFLYPFVETNAPGRFDCDTDREKARRVAAALVTDWTIARRLAEANGIRFAAFLQPALPLSRTRKDHLAGRTDAALAAQIAAVYPIIEYLVKVDGVHTLVGALDQDAYLFVDEASLSPAGNQAVAGAMAEFLN